MTSRIESIQKLQIIHASLPYKGGDWKDTLEQFSDSLPERASLVGLTDLEYYTLSRGMFAPRAASELFAALLEELPEVESEIPPVPSELRIETKSEMIDAALQLERLAGRLRLMAETMEDEHDVVDVFYTTCTFDLVKHEDTTYDRPVEDAHGEEIGIEETVKKVEIPLLIKILQYD